MGRTRDDLFPYRAIGRLADFVTDRGFLHEHGLAVRLHLRFGDGQFGIGVLRDDLLRTRRILSGFSDLSIAFTRIGNGRQSARKIRLGALGECWRG